jgi:hypothetical protein
MSTQRISSNATLALNIFFPIFWIVFFGSLTVALFLTDSPSGGLSLGPIKWVMLAIYLSGLVVLYLTLLKLKRVELDETHVYVSNYFKTYRYTYASVESLEISEFLFLSVGILRLRQAGRFGRRITFVMARAMYDDFIQSHPEIGQRLRAEG